MKVAVLSASPKQKVSLTLQIARALQKMCPEDEFDISFIKNVDDKSEFEAKANSSDLVIILSSLYHFNVHGQLIAFLDGIKLKPGTPFTYITSSGGNMDIPAHNFMRSFAKANNLLWIKSLSMLDEDILQELRREEVYRWYCYARDVATKKLPASDSLKGVKVHVLDAGDEAAMTEEMAAQTVEKYKSLGADVKLFNLREKNITGCVACFGCYTTNVCVLKDDFMELSKEVFEDADMVVTVSNTKYNQFGRRYKYFLDRHVTFGRYGQDREQYRAYICSGDISEADMVELEAHTLCVDTVDGDCFIGIYRENELDKMIQESALSVINLMFPQRNTHTYGLVNQFANLAYRLQYMTKNDYEYFKSRGYYEKPEIISTVKPIANMEEGKMSCKMRLMRFEEMLAKLEGPPKLTKRGDRSRKPVAADSGKKGFGLFRKNKN